MRLTPAERQALRHEISLADPAARIRLFGSRANDAAMGGDIDVELESPGSLIDRLRRAEKRGWVAHDGDFIRIRELRNMVVHGYADEKLAEIYQAILALTPALLDAVPKAKAKAKAWARAQS